MATNWQQGFNTGMQGAQIGGQVGGGWGALIGGVAGFVIGKDAADNQKMMMDKYNAEVLKFAAQDLFDLRRQQNIANMQTSQTLAGLQDSARVAKSTYNAQYGAAEILGSSADALKQVVDFQTNEAMARVWDNWETGVENYNTTIDQMTNQRVSSLKRFKDNQPVNFAELTKTGMSLYNQYGKAAGENVRSWADTAGDYFNSWGSNSGANANLNAAVAANN